MPNLSSQRDDATPPDPSELRETGQEEKERPVEGEEEQEESARSVEQDTDDEEAGASSLRTIALQTLALSVILVGVVILAASFFKEPLTQFANWIIETFGMAGVLLGIIAADVFTFPIPPDLFIGIAATSDAPTVPMLIAICITSVAAGSVSYVLGPQLRRIGFIERRLERWRPKGEVLFGRYGVWAVAIGALSPLPYSITCWMAGIYGMPYTKFFLATLFRAPRMVAYYLLIMAGWGMG